MAPRRKGDATKRQEADDEQAPNTEVSGGIPRVFVDLDGTLVDFAAGVRDLGADVEGDRTAMWEAVARSPKFWRNLRWLPDGQELWKSLEAFQPAVLTGLPNSQRKQAEDQKRAWCREHLGPSVEVICVSASDKGRHSAHGRILVDDDERHRESWEQRGGRFVARADVSVTLRAVQAASVERGGCRLPSVDGEFLQAIRHGQWTDATRVMRSLAAAAVRGAVDACFGGRFHTVVVGSSGAGLASGTSDLDFALVPAHGETSASSEGLLEALAHILDSESGMSEVQVILTRSKAPNVLKCVHTASGIQCDVVAQPDPNGAVASVDKCALLAEFGALSAYFRPLTVLVKDWAKSRHLVDPAGRKLNSFTFTLMSAFFLQVAGFLPIADLSHEAVVARRKSLLAAEDVVDQDCAPPVGMVALLQGFFAFWRQFDFSASCASVLVGTCCPIEAATLQPHDTEPVFVVIDPVEPDENTARTLAQRNLEELRAELNRAKVLMSDGETWEEVCRAPLARKTKELKKFYLSGLHSMSSQAADAIGSGIMQHKALQILGDAPLSDEVKASVEHFVQEALVGSSTCVAHRLPVAERRALQKLADACNIEMQGKFDIEFQKSSVWSAVGPGEHTDLPQPWTCKDRERLRCLVLGDSAPLEAQQPPSSLCVPSAKVIHQHSCLKTVRMLRQGTSLETLQSRYKLILKKHPRSNVVQLSYMQTESQMSSPVVQECRGLILEIGTWNVVSLPFTKFFNHGERNAKVLDWAGGVSVREKLDGSIVTLYWNQGMWAVASNKLPAADGLVPDGGTRSFADAFWEVWTKKGYKLPVNTNACFMFELILPSHTIVVRYQESDLVCLGGRDLETLTELSCEEVGESNGWDTPKRFDDFHGLDAVLEAARMLNPVVQEGFVVVDRHWNRLKIKSASYVALHHLSGNACWRDSEQLSSSDKRSRTRSLLEIGRSNEGDEFLAYFPALEDEFHAVCAKLSSLKRYLTHVASSGQRVLWDVHGLDRLLRKMCRGDCTAEQLLREMKLQDLEAAIDLLPSNAVLDLPGMAATETPRTCNLGLQCETPALAEEPAASMTGAKAGELDLDEDAPQELRKQTPNRFAAFNADSSSDSE